MHGVSEPSRGARGRGSQSLARQRGSGGLTFYFLAHELDAGHDSRVWKRLESLFRIPGAAKQADQENCFNSAHFHTYEQTQPILAMVSIDNMKITILPRKDESAEELYGDSDRQKLKHTLILEIVPLI